MINKEEIDRIQKEIKDNIDILITRIIDLQEREREHQKLNGKLQQRITELEEICKGKSIQELGVSKLYEEDKG